MKKIALIFLMILIFGCRTKTPTGENYLRFAWWGNSERSGRTAKVAILFENANSGVKVEAESDEKNAYFDRLNLSAAYGTLPDLIQLDSTALLNWAKAGRLADLTPRVNRGEIDMTKMDKNALDSGSVGGKIFGICAGMSALVIVANPAILASAGVSAPSDWTWSDFEKTAMKVFRQTGVKTADFGNDSSSVFEVILRQKGKQLFSDDGKTLGFSDTKDTEAFFAMLLRLAKSGALLTSDDSAAAFAEEKSWCVLAWLDEVSSLQTTFGKSTVVSPLPKNPDSAENGAFLKPALFFAIPESAENPSLAAKMIDFLLNDESAAGVLSFERGVPAAKFFRNRIAENDGESVAADFLSAPVLRAEGSAEREVRRIFHEIERAVINGEISAAEGARMFVDRGTIELSK